MAASYPARAGLKLGPVLGVTHLFVRRLAAVARMRPARITPTSTASGTR